MVRHPRIPLAIGDALRVLTVVGTVLGCRVSRASGLDASKARAQEATVQVVRAEAKDEAIIPVVPSVVSLLPSERSPTQAWRPPEAHCVGHSRSREVLRRAKGCPDRTVEHVVEWQPDAIMVLGGGMRADGSPSCATVQRGFLAAQLDEALATTPPTFIFSGAGNDSRTAKVMDDEDARCVAARLRQEATSTRSSMERQRLAREADTVRAGGSWVMFEADAMCAVMLRRTDPSRRATLLPRVRFEAQATTTAQNALFTRPILAEGHFRRVLVLTSPVLKRFGRGSDLHADRALGGFQRVRGNGGWALAAVGCPLLEGPGVYTWYQFERTDTMPEGMVMGGMER